MRTHATPNVWERTNSHKMGMFYIWVYMNMGNAKFHTMGILWKKLIYSHTVGLEQESIGLKYPHNSQIWETSFHRFPNV